MAGGTFTTQNKVRPGAYINFKAKSKPKAKLSDRGIITFPTPMSWGEEGALIELLNTDLEDGKSLPKIGYTGFDKESLIYKEGLKYCKKALIYRLDSGGTKASVISTATGLTVTAKYSGIVGNDIKFAVAESSDAMFDVITLVRGAEVDRQTIETYEDLVTNDWVTFSFEAAEPQETAGESLSGGANGTVNNTRLADYLAQIKMRWFDTMAIPIEETAGIAESIISFIKNRRDGQGKACQVVLHNCNKANHEGVISVLNGYRSATDSIPGYLFTVTFASMTAGAEITKSNTYQVLEDAVEIIGALSDEEIEQALIDGHIVISTLEDGEIVIEQDINTLHNYSKEKDYAYSKNRVIRTLDAIRRDVKALYDKNYLGKVDNRSHGRNLLKADIIRYLTTLQDLGAVQNFLGADDIEVLAGVEIDAVVINLSVQPVDSMEKLYMTVTTG